MRSSALSHAKLNGGPRFYRKMTGRRGGREMRGRAERSRTREGASGGDEGRERAIATCGVGLLVGVSRIVVCVCGMDGWSRRRERDGANRKGSAAQAAAVMQNRREGCATWSCDLAAPIRGCWAAIDVEAIESRCGRSRVEMVY